MTVDDELILHLAKLSRLELTGESAIKLRADLMATLAMVEKLNELDLGSVLPLRYPIEVVTVLRPDTVGNHLERKAAMENAPDGDGVFLRVPRVI